MQLVCPGQWACPVQIMEDYKTQTVLCPALFKINLEALKIRIISNHNWFLTLQPKNKTILVNFNLNFKPKIIPKYPILL